MSQPWWKTAVFYQIYPRSFADSNGDGVGDLEGIRRRLDHVADLGVDAIWISPFFRSPMADFGYDVADYCDVDPIFGRLVDFDALITDAHARNIMGIVKRDDFADVDGGLVQMADESRYAPPEVHARLRAIRTLLDSYPGDRAAVGEVFILSTAKVAEYYGADDELHLAFNFPPL